MKIEKLNENQIRCTLTHADLAERHLKLSELAYGTEKAKSLFRDMMQQASFDFGFEAEDIPLMIEAIPASSDSIVLIITKVEDPEELDTRFSKFTSVGDTDGKTREPLSKLEGAEEFMDLLNKVKDAAASVEKSASKETSGTDSEQNAKPAPEAIPVKLFSFESIDLVIHAARLIAPLYKGANTLYRDPINEMYLLALTPSDHTKQEFNKACNMLSEFGAQEKASASVLAFLEEHCEITIASDAIQKLSIL